YQARLQARFGRNWRRKAPIESMMPLRLAKYGFPLAETAPAGLAAAGIEEPIRTVVERDGVSGEAPVLAIGHQRVGERDTESEHPVAAVREAAVTGFGATVQQAAPAAPAPVLPDVDYLAAAEGYVAQRGHFPDAEQFGLFLAQHGIVELSTREPLPGMLLEPVLDELWGAHHEKFIQHGQAPTSAGDTPTGPRFDVGTLPAPGGGTSAWFGSEPKAPVEATAQDKLEDPAGWNRASGDTAPDDGRSSSSAVPHAAAVSGGATAARTGERRRVVQMRIPEGDETDGASPADSRDDAQPDREEPPGRESSPLTGAGLVAARYLELTAEERSRSANSLAPLLAEGTGYTVGTVRKYLGDIKRAERQTVAAD
ncbi:hypothetical protein ACWDN8_36935, partial [Streptomyces rubiginosohelvolus]